MRGFRAEMGGQFWHEGQTERNGHVFRWEAKVYPEGSACGINGGKISKLWIAELPPGEVRYWQEAAYYDRGWCTLPSTQEVMDFVDELLERFQ